MQIASGGDTYDITVRRVGMTANRPLHLFTLLQLGAGWLWHQTRHRDEWFVEVTRRVPTKEMLERAVPFAFHWRSEPIRGAQAARAEADRVAAIIASGTWPESAVGYVQR